jgi:hypothetical protein
MLSSYSGGKEGIDDGWYYFSVVPEYGRGCLKWKKPSEEGYLGWLTGLEPATSGTTIQRSNQLSYNHHLAVLSLLKKERLALHFPKALQRYNKFQKGMESLCKKIFRLFLRSNKTDMPVTKFFLLAFSLFLLASNCANDKGRSSKASRFEVELLCETLSADEAAPQSAVYAIVNQNKVKIANSSTCAPLSPDTYEDYGIPSNALAAVGGWWAGSGGYFYALEEDGIIVFYQGTLDEMQEDDEGFFYQKLAKFEDGRFSVQLPGVVD